MADILDRDDVAAVPQQDDARCIYASDGQALVSVSVRTREQFDAERDRFENSGVKGAIVDRVITARADLLR